jgi:hypothetical protein
MKRNTFDVAGAKRRVRVITLLDAAESAGLAPMPVTHVHAAAYLSNVLAPVWELWPLDGRLLKRRGGPFYPEIQYELDRMVGQGVVVISNVSHILDQSSGWRLEGSYRLNRSFADPIIARIDSFPDEREIATFIRELLFALATMADDELVDAISQDATYMDANVDIGSVIDFDEWTHRNFSANAAQHFAEFTDARQFTTAGEKIHLYVSHMRTRLERAIARV